MIKNSLTVTFGSFFSLAINFISQMIIAATFGSGVQMDSYLTAIVVPTYVTNVLIAGGLTFVLIPVFTEQKEKSEESAWALLGTVLIIVILFLIALSVFGYVFAPEIISLTAPGFIGAKREMAVTMLRISIFTIPFSGLYSLAFNIQTVFGNYLLPAMSGGISSLVNLAFIILFKNVLGPFVLPWGNFIYVIIQSLVVSFPIIKHRWTYIISVFDHQILAIFKLLLPLLSIGIFSQIVPLIERFLLSSLPDGDLSNYGYATKITQIFLSLFGGGLATSIFPEIARKFSEGNESKFKETIIYGVRLTIALTMPIIVLLIFFRTDIARLVYERGAFSHQSTLVVSSLLPLLLITILFQMVSNVLTRVYYVLKNTLTPSLVSLFAIGIYVFFAFKFVKSNGLFGLTISNTIRYFLFTTIILIMLTKLLNLRSIQGWILRYLTIGSILSLSVFFIIKVINIPNRLLFITFTSITAFSIYLVLLRVFDKQIFMDFSKLVMDSLLTSRNKLQDEAKHSTPN